MLPCGVVVLDSEHKAVLSNAWIAKMAAERKDNHILIDASEVQSQYASQLPAVSEEVEVREE
jgi:hypothetical protein